MKRRNFIRLSASGSAGAFMLNGHVVSAFSETSLLSQIPEDVLNDRCLVMVQLRGGNDGLNTIIPLDQYDTYANLRPTIKLKNSGSNAAIQLDSTLSNENQMLIHPSLSAFKELYDSGKLNIVHSVGYPIVNKSHFAGRAMMFKGGDGTPENSQKTSGWMARFLHSRYNYEDFQDPLGIQLGSKKPSLGFHSEHEHKVDVNLSGQDISGYYNVISNIGNPKPESSTDSDYTDNIDFISSIEQSTTAYSQRISQVFNAGSNVGSYPDYDLANQLKTVARMIKGGSRTKMFLVVINGFDNHAKQVSSSSDSHKGDHADLLKAVGDSIKAFHNDLDAMGIEDKVVTATFTEFGRKPKENGNLGTDHGNLGPMFIIGKHVKGGVTGTNMDLSSVVKHYDESQMQHDYRQVFSTLLSDFLGTHPGIIENTEFTPFDGTNKLDLIQDNQKSDTLGAEDLKIKTQELKIAPNPVRDECLVTFLSGYWFRGIIEIYNLQGRLVNKLPVDVASGLNNMSLNLSHMKSGVYLLAIKNNHNKPVGTTRLIKR